MTWNEDLNTTGRIWFHPWTEHPTTLTPSCFSGKLYFRHRKRGKGWNNIEMYKLVFTRHLLLERKRSLYVPNGFPYKYNINIMFSVSREWLLRNPEFLGSTGGLLLRNTLKIHFHLFPCVLVNPEILDSDWLMTVVHQEMHHISEWFS